MRIPPNDCTETGRQSALHPDLRERDAADVIHTLIAPEVYRLLVVDRRWKPARYQQWLTQVLTPQLLWVRAAPG